MSHVNSDWRRLIKRKGDKVTAQDWNDLVELAGRSNIGPLSIVSSLGTLHRFPTKHPASASIAGTYAMITSIAGTVPPYLYAAEEATMDVNGIWTKVTDGKVFTKVYNFEEQGAGGQFVNPLLNGDVVFLRHAPDQSVDAYIIDRGHYRGSF